MQEADYRHYGVLFSFRKSSTVRGTDDAVDGESIGNRKATARREQHLNCVPLALPVCISPSPRYSGERAVGATGVEQTGVCSTKGGSLHYQKGNGSAGAIALPKTTDLRVTT